MGIWLQRSSLLINRVYLHKLGVGSPKVQTLDAFVDLNAAVYKAVHAALLGPSGLLATLSAASLCCGGQNNTV